MDLERACAAMRVAGLAAWVGPSCKGGLRAFGYRPGRLTFIGVPVACVSERGVEFDEVVLNLDRECGGPSRGDAGCQTPPVRRIPDGGSGNPSGGGGIPQVQSVEDSFPETTIAAPALCTTQLELC